MKPPDWYMFDQNANICSIILQIYVRIYCKLCRVCPLHPVPVSHWILGWCIVFHDPSVLVRQSDDRSNIELSILKPHTLARTLWNNQLYNSEQCVDLNILVSASNAQAETQLICNFDTFPSWFTNTFIFIMMVKKYDLTFTFTFLAVVVNFSLLGDFHLQWAADCSNSSLFYCHPSPTLWGNSRSKNNKKNSFWHLAQRGTLFLLTLFLHKLIHKITCMYLCSDRTLLLAKYSTSIFLLSSQSASALTEYFSSWKFLASALRSLSAQGDETLVSRCALCNYCVASKTSDKWKENMEQSKANQSSLWVGERGQEQQRHRYLPRCTIRDAPTTQQPTTTNSTQQPNNNKNQTIFQQQQSHQHPLQQPNMQGPNNHPKTTKFTT